MSKSRPPFDLGDSASSSDAPELMGSEGEITSPLGAENSFMQTLLSNSASQVVGAEAGAGGGAMLAMFPSLLPLYIQPDKLDCQTEKSSEDDLRMLQIQQYIAEASEQFDIPQELIAVTLQLENQDPEKVRTTLQDAESFVQGNLAKLFYGYSDEAPSNDKDGVGIGTFGLANINPNSAVTTLNLLKQYRPEMISGVLDIDSEKEVIDTIMSDEGSVYLLAANLRAYLEVNAANGQTDHLGTPFSTNGSDLTQDQMAFMAKYHNNPGYKGYGHWTQLQAAELLSAHRDGEDTLKFLDQVSTSPSTCGPVPD